MSRKFRAVFRRTLCGVNGSRVSPRLRCCCPLSCIMMLNCGIGHRESTSRQSQVIQHSPGHGPQGHPVAIDVPAVMLQEEPVNRPNVCLEVASSGPPLQSHQAAALEVNPMTACTGNHLLVVHRPLSLVFYDRASQQQQQQMLRRSEVRWQLDRRSAYLFDDLSSSLDFKDKTFETIAINSHHSLLISNSNTLLSALHYLLTYLLFQIALEPWVLHLCFIYYIFSNKRYRRCSVLLTAAYYVFLYWFRTGLGVHLM